MTTTQAQLWPIAGNSGGDLDNACMATLPHRRDSVLPHFNDLTNKIQGTMNRITYFTVHVIGLVSETLGTVAVFYVAARIRWYFPLIALAMMTIRFAVDQQIGRRIVDTWHEIMPIERKRSYFHGRCWAREFARDVRMLQLGDMLASLRSQYSKEMRDKIYQINMMGNRGQYVSLALDTTFNAFALVSSLIMIRAGQITLGELTMIWQIVQQLGQRLGALSSNFFGMYSFIADLAVQKEVLDLCVADERLPTIGALDSETVVRDLPSKSDNVFELNDIHFSYREDREALCGITLSIPRGQVVALVGENGAGKSTLVKVMLGLYPPTSGDIKFEGYRYGELERNYLLKRIGVAFQEPVQYQYTIRENIGFGNLAQLNNLDAIRSAAEKGGAAEFIRDLAVDNYEANLGRYLNSDGLELSGGQWQRLGYALSMFINRHHVNEMRFLGLGNIIYNKWKQAVKEVLKERQALNLSLSFYNMLARLFMNIAVTVSLAIVAWNIFTGVMSVGVFAMISSAIQSFYYSLRSISHDLIYIGYGAKYVTDFRNLLDEKSEVMLGEHEPVPENVEIKFKDVHFRYPRSDRDAIDGVSVRFRPGEKVAVVGENGSGKSTFAALLTGLFAAQSGTVEFNGRDIMECLGTARKSISCVFQEYGKFELPVKEFIRIGDLSRDVGDEEIQQVACAAGADDFIRKLPNGYDTDLGTLGEIGIDISGGEWQRLLLARALIRKGARVMVLDEPTAALDPGRTDGRARPEG